MRGKIIVISGATKGIGLALKEKLSKDNAVVTFSRSEKENGETAFGADVSDRAAVERVFGEIGRLYGHIDVLINNAGYGLSGATEFLPEEEIEKITDVNFLGTVRCCQCALPYMKRGSVIANIASASGITPMPYRAMYNSTKAAVITFSHSLNAELKHLGIGCASFVLGPVDTDFAKHRIIYKTDDERYAEDLKAVDDFVDNPARGGKMKLDFVVNYIARKLDSRRTRLFYIVGFRNRLAAVIVKFFPSFSMRVLNRVMRGRS